MSEDPDVRIVRIGPLVIGLRRRRQPMQEWVEVDAAVKDLGRALLATPAMRLLIRAMDWLERRLGRQ